MASWELQLVSSILKDEESPKLYNEARSNGIDAKVFGNAEARSVWSFLDFYFNRPADYGRIPSEQLVEERFPSLDLPDPAESFNDLCSMVNDKHTTRKVDQALAKYAEDVRSGPKIALADLTLALERIKEQITIGTDKSFDSDAIMEIIEDIDARAENKGLVGMPFPWEQFNKELGGLQKGDFGMIYAMPKSMKCVAAGQRVLQRNGKYTAIEDLPEDCEVPSLTFGSKKIRWARAKRIDSGTKECVRITTSSGKVIDTSLDHPYLRPDYTYSRAEDLSVGDFVGTARTYRDTDANDMTADDAYFAGIMVGDGCMTRSEVLLTTTDEHILSFAVTYAAEHDCIVNATADGITYRIVGKEHGVNNTLNLLRSMGVHGKKSVDKTSPPQVFGASKAVISAYLSGLLDTDGGVYTSGHNVRFNTSSLVLAKEIVVLLDILGVRAALGSVHPKGGQTAYTVNMFSKENHVRLYRAFGEHIRVAHKHAALQKIAEWPCVEKRNKDGIPRNKALEDAIDLASSGKSYPCWGTGDSKIQRAHLFRRSGNISRALLSKVAAHWESDELMAEASSDVIWEPIVSIEHIGTVPCFDVCIDDGLDDNFVCEGFIIHNTWIGLYICLHLATSGYKTMIYSKEMTWEKMRTRIACLLAKIDYTKYRHGTMTEAEKEEVIKAAVWFVEECPGSIEFTRADRPDGSAGGPAEIREKIQVYKPDFVLLDSAYLLELPGMKMSAYDWKTMLLMTKDLKQIAISCDIPILAIFQESEDKALKSKGTRGTVSLALSKMMIQDVDLAIRCIYNKAAREMSLQLPAARETAFEGITIYAHACENFGYAHDRMWEVGDGAGGDDEFQQAEAPRPVEQAISAFGNSFRDGFKRGMPPDMTGELAGLGG